EATRVCSDGSTIVGAVYVGFDLSTVLNGAPGFWREGGGMPLGAGVPSGCSADGRVQAGYVEQWYYPMLIGPPRLIYASIYVDDGSSTNWAELIKNSPDAAGWTLNSVAGISDDGKVLAGDGRHDGHDEGWVAHLP
ncbi:MAG TPA: hypothetical protein VFQ35_26820, partial [Polyangiaceae bacterium]|nr:hypothetical protein [Polyangiaceae bacterium]